VIRLPGCERSQASASSSDNGCVAIALARAVPGQTAASTAVGAEPGTSVKFIVMVAGLFFDGLEPPSMA